MNKKPLLLLSVLFPFGLLAQGVITDFYTIPLSPTINDEVKVVAELSFTSGDCPLAEQGHSTTGNRTQGFAHHCLGMLTVICTTTDTFDLGNLPAGDHTFVLTLSAGSGPDPCSPGIVPEDVDSITFTINPGVGMHSPETQALNVSVYPNPATTSIILQSELEIKNGELKIMNAQAQLVTLSIVEGQQTTIDISTISTGLYYLTLRSNEGVALKKFEVIR